MTQRRGMASTLRMRTAIPPEQWQPWPQPLENFTVLLEKELFFLLPFPTPNSMLILNHRDLHQSVNIDLGGKEGLEK